MPLAARGVEKRYYADGYWRDTSLPALLVGEHSGYLGWKRRSYWMQRSRATGKGIEPMRESPSCIATKRSSLVFRARIDNGTVVSYELERDLRIVDIFAAFCVPLPFPLCEIFLQSGGRHRINRL